MTPLRASLVGVGTNWADDPQQGDVFALSPAVQVAR